MPYTTSTAKLSEKSSRLQLQEDGQPLSFAAVVHLWENNPPFRDFYVATLLKHGGNGCFWEHPRLNKTTAGQPYECVLTSTNSFSVRTANFTPFSRAVDSNRMISVFPNLDGTALLVVPNQPEVPAFNGRDLMAFLHTAPGPLIHEFWTTVGQVTGQAIAEASAFQFLSTHGLGVIWLHVRLEERPKYYHHRPYRRQ